MEASNNSNNGSSSLQLRLTRNRTTSMSSISPSFISIDSFATQSKHDPAIYLHDVLRHKPKISISLPEIKIPEPPTFDISIPANLTEKLAGDVMVAVTVTAAVAPFLTVVDKALVQRSAGSHTILGSARSSLGSMLRHPIQYLRSPTFLWMWMTYAATYTAANGLRTITEHQEYLAARSQTSNSSSKSKSKASSASSSGGTALFLGTTAVNTTASLVKDRAYARLFGSANPTGTVPRVSYALWMARDFTVIGSSFILPQHVATWLQETRPDMSEKDALKVAQVGSPMAAQLVAGPLHFVGLDCYNRYLTELATSKARLLERLAFLKANVTQVVAARMARILPGYGIAGVYNTHFRSAWRDYLIVRQVEQLRNGQKSASVQNLVELIRAKQN